MKRVICAQRTWIGGTISIFFFGIAARPVLVVKFGKGNEYLNSGEV